MKKEIYEKIHKEYLKHDSLCMLYELGHIVLGGLMYRTYAPPIYLPDNKRKFVYIVNPKVANSSIKASIMGTDKIEDNGAIHRMVKKQVIHRWRKKYDSYYKFTFVRNPFERMVSCYVHRYQAPEKWIGKKNSYKYYLFGYIKNVNGFDEFVRKTCKIPDRLMDIHFKPQYLLIYDRGRISVDFVGRYENLNEDWKVVQKKHQLKNLPHLNQGKKKNWMDFYTRELADIVYERYKNDFELFGYQDEYVKLLEYLEQKDRIYAERT